jgi:hypothetical protein
VGNVQQRKNDEHSPDLPDGSQVEMEIVFYKPKGEQKTIRVQSPYRTIGGKLGN